MWGAPPSRRLKDGGPFGPALRQKIFVSQQQRFRSLEHGQPTQEPDRGCPPHGGSDSHALRPARQPAPGMAQAAPLPRGT